MCTKRVAHQICTVSFSYLTTICFFHIHEDYFFWTCPLYKLASLAQYEYFMVFFFYICIVCMSKRCNFYRIIGDIFWE
jgi:hypothetical protein